MKSINQNKPTNQQKPITQELRDFIPNGQGISVNEFQKQISRLESDYPSDLMLIRVLSQNIDKFDGVRIKDDGKEGKITIRSSDPKDKDGFISREEYDAVVSLDESEKNKLTVKDLEKLNKLSESAKTRGQGALGDIKKLGENISLKFYGEYLIPENKSKLTEIKIKDKTETLKLKDAKFKLQIDGTYLVADGINQSDLPMETFTLYYDGKEWKADLSRKEPLRCTDSLCDLQKKLNCEITKINLDRKDGKLPGSFTILKDGKEITCYVEVNGNIYIPTQVGFKGGVFRNGELKDEEPLSITKIMIDKGISLIPNSNGKFENKDGNEYGIQIHFDYLRQYGGIALHCNDRKNSVAPHSLVYSSKEIKTIVDTNDKEVFRFDAGVVKFDPSNKTNLKDYTDWIPHLIKIGLIVNEDGSFSSYSGVCSFSGKLRLSSQVGEFSWDGGSTDLTQYVVDFPPCIIKSNNFKIFSDGKIKLDDYIFWYQGKPIKETTVWESLPGAGRKHPAQ